MNFINFGCCLLIHLVVVASGLLYVWVSSLGFDICGDPATDPDPLEPLEQQQQQGKLFDHTNPIFLLKLISIYNCMYALLFVVKIMVSHSYRCIFLGKCLFLYYHA